jgi:hypothetical protein
MVKMRFLKHVLSIMCLLILTVLFITQVSASIDMQEWSGIELIGHYYQGLNVDNQEQCKIVCHDDNRCKGATYDPTRCNSMGQCACTLFLDGLENSKTNPKTISFVKKAYGKLDLRSTPTGARVFVDQVDMGITPQLRVVETGSHLVEFELNGYYAHSEFLDVSEGQTTGFNAQLEKIEVPTSSITQPPSRVTQPGFLWIGASAALIISLLWWRAQQ